MKQWWKKIVVFLAVAGIFLGTSRNVMAEGTQISSEIVEKYIGQAGTFYDVGGSVGNGAFEIKSNSSSLKAGDTVEVQVIYNTDNAGYTLDTLSMSLYYDKDLLQYSETIMNDAYVAEYDFNGYGREDSKGVFLWLEFLNTDKPFDKNGSVATVRFTVKQDTSAITIYGGDIDASSGDGAQIYHYLTDQTDDGGYKMMSVTIEDTSAPAPTPTTNAFALSNGTVKGKGEISIPIKIQTNDGFAALGLTINYDTTLFDYKVLEVDDNLKDKIALKDIYPTNGQIKAAFIAGQNITDTGNFLNLMLETKEGATAGVVSDVTVTITQAANYEEKSLNATGGVYKVTLAQDTPEPSGQLLGDVNNDGNIDLIDALWILQYYNNVKELTDDEKTAADVDKNGTVDLVDALRIMKYYNGEISNF